MAMGATLVALLIPGSSPTAAQTMRGLLLERGSDRPIGQGSITMIDARGDTVASGLSNERGLFVVSGSDGGEFRLIARALGYQAGRTGPFDVQDGGLMVVQVLLDPEPVPIAGVDVEADAVSFEEPYLAGQGFYEREQLGMGRFLGPEDLAREAPLIHRTGELLRKMPGVFVSPDGRMASMRSVMGGRCIPALFIDGIRARLGPYPSLDDLAWPEDLAGVEVYPRPLDVPLQYQWAAEGCGVIVFWTKH